MCCDPSGLIPDLAGLPAGLWPWPRAGSRAEALPAAAFCRGEKAEAARKKTVRYKSLQIGESILL